MATFPVSEPTSELAPSQRSGAPQWRAFLSMGFRPFYLVGCLWAAFSVALWVYTPQLIVGLIPGPYWHAHEMLWGFVATIAVGFLLTAVNNWTGINPASGAPLARLVLFWLAARIAYLLPGATPFWVGFGAETCFFVCAALALGRAVYASPAVRNYGVPMMIAGLGLFNALFLLSIWQAGYAYLMQIFSAGMLCMAIIAILIARRVIPFFASRGVPGLNIPMLATSGRWQLSGGLIALLGILFDLPVVVGLALATAGVIALCQVLVWKPWAVLHKPILWILYAGYSALGIGLLAAACQYLGLSSLRTAWFVHIIGVGGFSVLIIGMVTRTALGHLGQTLATDRSMVTSYVLIIVAAFLRLAALADTPYVIHFLHSAAMFWVLGFSFYLWRFTPWMIRSR